MFETGNCIARPNQLSFVWNVDQSVDVEVLPNEKAYSTTCEYKEIIKKNWHYSQCQYSLFTISRQLCMNFTMKITIAESSREFSKTSWTYMI